uniref:sugar ABC transporter ATP-binding protein n=1 Tax=Salinibacterium sp. TaxID=1915057 RepID=UPI00286BF917
CDRITVMRDGRYIGTHEIDKVSVDDIVREMVGRNIEALFPKEDAEIGEAVLEVSGLGRAGVFAGIDLVVRSGEIVGLSGLVGAGRTEIARAIFGIDRYDTGSVRFLGQTLPAHNPMAAIEAGMGFVPEDRRRQGLVMDLSVARNTALTLRNRLARFGFISSAAERKEAAIWIRLLQVKGSLDASVSTLSGGNQQKVVLAKWLATEPRLLIVDEPTRGIDVGTKAEVHRLLSELAGRGIAILMISSELPEVLGMSDRVLVVREGRIVAELDRTEASPESVMHAATGAREEAP